MSGTPKPPIYLTPADDEPMVARWVRPTGFRTAAEWHASLGGVPLDRIVFDPLPGTATEADVVWFDEHEGRLCELVRGTLVEKTMGMEEGLIEAILIEVLGAFVRPRKLGRVGSASSMMKLLGTQVRLPDVSYFSNATLALWNKIDKVPVLRPDLAVEVLSDGNTPQEMAIKLAEYFEAGTPLVWYADPRTKTVDVYVPPSSTTPTTLTLDDTLTGGDVLPGFSVRVADIFDIA